MDIILYLTLIFSFSSLYFLIYWLYVTFQKWDSLKTKIVKPEKKVSIIIPAYNEEEDIKSSINSCLNLNYPKDCYEIIVVNDGSTDKTEQICKEYEKRGLIRYFYKLRGGKGSALNCGIKKSNYEFVCTLDADSMFTKDALNKLISFFDNEKVAAVTPAMKVFKPQNLLQRFQEIEYIVAIFLAKLFSFFNSIYITPGPGSIYRKKALLEVDCYNENCITEDMEVAFKLQKEKYKIKNSLDACVYTKAPSTFLGLLKQRIRWNSGFLETLFMHHDLLKQKRSLTRFIIPYNIYFIVASFIFAYITLFKPLYSLLKEFVKYNAIGFDIKFVLPTINKILVDFLFRLNSSSTMLLITFMIFAFFIAVAHKFTNENMFSRSKVFYSFMFIAFYPALLAIFSISAVFYFIKYCMLKNKFETW